MQRLLHAIPIFLLTLLFISCGGDNGTPNPEIDGIQPESGPPGTMVTISGSGFSPDAANNTVTFDGTQAPVNNATESSIETQVPDGFSTGSVQIEVTVRNQSVTGPGFMVEQSAPGISSVQPDSGTVGTEVTITGMNFSTAPSENTITFAGTSAPVISAAEDELLTEVPQGATDGPVEVTVDGETVTGTDFEVITDGTLRAVITTSGSDKDSDGYSLTVDLNNSVTTDSSDTIFVSDLEEGSHDVELTDVASNCSVSGDNPRSISVVAGDTTSTTFDVNCQASAKNQIVYEHNSEIYLMDADGSNKHQLTDNNYVDDYPVTSHDGTQIAFSCDRNGNYNICIMKADGSNLRQLTSSGTNLNPAWSPDDSRIVFQSNRDGDDELYIMNVEGTSLQQLTQNSVADREPDWSPSGDRITLVSTRNSTDNIYTIRTDGSDLEQITNTSDFEAEPRWSPDGDEILFNSDKNSAGDLYTINSDGTGLQRVTTDGARSAGWSPDGSELVFQSTRSGGRKIYKVNADGTGLVTNLTPNSDGEQPHWSPLE